MYMVYTKKDLTHGPRMLKAAGQCGLPICLGISTRLLADHTLVWRGDGANTNSSPSHDDDQPVDIPVTATELKRLIELAGSNLVAVNVMHTSFKAVSPTVALLRQVYRYIYIYIYILFSLKRKETTIEPIDNNPDDNRNIPANPSLHRCMRGVWVCIPIMVRARGRTGLIEKWTCAGVWSSWTSGSGSTASAWYGMCRAHKVIRPATVFSSCSPNQPNNPTSVCMVLDI